MSFFNNYRNIQQQKDKLRKDVTSLQNKNKANRLLLDLKECDHQEKKLAQQLPSCPIKGQPFRNETQKQRCTTLEKILPKRISTCTNLENQILQLGGTLPSNRQVARLKEDKWIQELQNLEIPKRPIRGGKEDSKKRKSSNKKQQSSRVVLRRSARKTNNPYSSRNFIK